MLSGSKSHDALCVSPCQAPCRRWRLRRPQEAEGAAVRASVHGVCGKPAVQHGAGRHRHHLQRAQHPQRPIGQRQRDRQVQRSEDFIVCACSFRSPVLLFHSILLALDQVSVRGDGSTVNNSSTLNTVSLRYELLTQQRNSWSPSSCLRC